MFRKRLSIYDHFYNSDIEQAIDQTVHSERDREIMRYKIVDGLTYEEIAEIPLPHKKYSYHHDRYRISCTSMNGLYIVIWLR